MKNRSTALVDAITVALLPLLLSFVLQSCRSSAPYPPAPRTQSINVLGTVSSTGEETPTAADFETTRALASATAFPAPSTILSVKNAVTPNGRSFRIIRTTEKDIFHERGEEEVYEPEAGVRSAFRRRSPTGSDAFRGHDRAEAKVSIADAPEENLTSLNSLLKGLPSDNSMMHYSPPITRDPDSPRVAEENRNVEVDAYLYAAKREEDGDFHVIIGTNPNGSSTTRYMNVELSGLPTGGPSFDVLAQARADFKNYFGSEVPGSGGYDKYDGPIPVRVAGSLFYDIDHPPGQVGPKGMRPKTSWEIHPITRIAFEP